MILFCDCEWTVAKAGEGEGAAADCSEAEAWSGDGDEARRVTVKKKPARETKMR